MALARPSRYSCKVSASAWKRNVLNRGQIATRVGGLIHLSGDAAAYNNTVDDSYASDVHLRSLCAWKSVAVVDGGKVF